MIYEFQLVSHNHNDSGYFLLTLLVLPLELDLCLW